MAIALAVSSAFLALLGALLTWRAASIKIRHNIDEFNNDLDHQGRWYNRGALVIFVAAILNLLSQSLPLVLH